ncbi:MAG: tetratricopeptide repeat protein [Myxococcota bacterium]
MKRGSYWLLALSLSAAACQREKPSVAASAPAAARSAQEDRLEAARRIAVAIPNQQSAADLEIRKLATVAKAQPTRLASWIELGRAWVKKARASSDPGYYVNADACAQVALDLAPDDALALDLRALVLLNNHAFTEAKLLGEVLVKRNPESAMAWGSLSDALLELGEHEAAERAVRTMLDLKPNLPSYSRASYLHWLRGDHAGAKELARLAIDASDDPRQPEPRAWMIVQAAQLFWHVGDVPGAAAGFEKALEVLPDYAPALVGRGRVALASGDAAEAARIFARAFERSPLPETAWLLGQARELNSDSTGAAAAYADAEREGRRSDPRTLALMFASRGHSLDEALMLAERERRVRADIYTEDTLAFAQYRKGLLKDAKASIERARRLGTLDARLLFHEGAIRLALGERNAGRKLLKQALGLNPHFDEFGAREARALLQGAT